MTAGPGTEPASLWRLLLAIPLAALRLWVGRLPSAVIGVVLTVCGLALMLSPLALWVAWTTTIFNAVLLIAALALLVALAVVALARDEQL